MLTYSVHSVHLKKWKTIQMSSEEEKIRVWTVCGTRNQETSAVVIPARWMSEKSLISFWSVGWICVCVSRTQRRLHFNPCTHFEHNGHRVISLFLSLGFFFWQANWWIWAFNSLFFPRFQNAPNDLPNDSRFSSIHSIQIGFLISSGFKRQNSGDKMRECVCTMNWKLRVRSIAFLINEFLCKITSFLAYIWFPSTQLALTQLHFSIFPSIERMPC